LSYLEDAARRAAADPSPLYHIENAADLARTVEMPIVFDVDALLPADDAPALFFGPPGGMKSWHLLHLCACIATGKPFLGAYPVRQRPTLYVNLDAGPETFRRRVRRVTDSPAFEFVTLSAGEFSNDVLRALLAQYAGRFVALDCLSALYTPDPHRDVAHDMRIFVDGLRALYKEHGCGGMVLDHPHRPREAGKPGDYYGSIQKEAAFRIMWTIEPEPVDLERDRALRNAKILCRKLSEGEFFPPIRTEVNFADPRLAFTTTTDAATNDRERLAEDAILRWADRQHEAFSKRTVIESVRGYRAASLRRAFEDLTERGDLEPTGAKRGSGSLYRKALSPGSGTHSDPRDPLGSGIVGPGSLLKGPTIPGPSQNGSEVSV
jgi:hypothetical protein